MNLPTVLKMLGVKIAPEQIAQLEIVIPQIPARAVEIIRYVNESVARFDQRLAGLEQGQMVIIRKLDGLQLDIKNMRENEDYAGAGATQHLLESGDIAGLPSMLMD